MIELIRADDAESFGLCAANCLKIKTLEVRSVEKMVGWDFAENDFTVVVHRLKTTPTVEQTRVLSKLLNLKRRAFEVVFADGYGRGVELDDALTDVVQLLPHGLVSGREQWRRDVSRNQKRLSAGRCRAQGNDETRQVLAVNGVAFFDFELRKHLDIRKIRHRNAAMKRVSDAHRIEQPMVPVGCHFLNRHNISVGFQDAADRFAIATVGCRKVELSDAERRFVGWRGLDESRICRVFEENAQETAANERHHRQSWRPQCEERQTQKPISNRDLRGKFCPRFDYNKFGLIDAEERTKNE